MANKQTVLVTGGAGFIGSHLSEKLLDLGYKVVVIDNFQTGNHEHLQKCSKNKDFTLITGNVNNPHDVRGLVKLPIDYIYHYAASVGVVRTLSDRLEVLDDIDGIKNILNLAREKNVKRVLYSSSSEVYGESASFPQNENSTPINSKLPYAAVKNLGEIFIKTYHIEYGLKYTIFRFFNTYGPRQSPNFVISKFICQALKGENLTVLGDGSQSRSFMYIADNIKATTNALTAPAAVNATVNVGNPIEVQVNELAELILKVSRSPSKITHLPPLKEGDMQRRVPDISSMVKVLNTQPTTPLISGLKPTIDYFVNKT